MSAALSETLTFQLRMTGGIAGLNLEGITHEESLLRATPDGTHINWIVGHLVGIRCRLLPAIGQEPVFDPATATSYRASLTKDSIILPFEEVVRAYNQSTERMLAGIASATDELYAGPAPFSPRGDPNETVASLLTRFMIHEAYHLGQTGILRRVSGKEGAIKAR
jgi:hypothetical protein